LPFNANKLMLGILASVHPLQEFEKKKEITPGGPQVSINPSFLANLFLYPIFFNFIFGAKNIILPQ